MTSFINDNNEQIQYDGEILLTKQVASFRNFKIKGDVSVSFGVPNTSENRSALGYFGLNQTNSPVFSTNAFNLVKNGNTITRGYLVIESDDSNEISLFFISGNANWFRSFDFNCKEIRNTRYRSYWTYSQAEFTKSNTRGIIFPHIDWMYGREKFDNTTFIARVIDETKGARDAFAFTNLFPCLYINTLVEEIAKTAGIRLSGNLFDDKFYKQLIVTPSGPELYNDYGRISNFSASFDSDSTGEAQIIDIHNIAPDMKAIDIIKWLCFTFGCVPVFDEYSQTLSLNIIDKIRKENALDLSQYIQKYKIQYNQYQNNYLRVPEAPENEIQVYNEQNPDALFGELNIESQKNDGSNQELYESPFAPVADNVGTTPLKWATPFIEFYTLEDGDEIRYESVSDVGGKLSFNLIFNFDVSELFFDAVMVFRVKDDNDIYTGYHNIQFGTATSAQSSSDYISDSSGYVYIQKVKENETGPRVLVCIPNYPVANFTQYNAINIYRIGDITSVAYAYFHKPFYSLYSNLNGYRPGLSYGALAVTENTVESVEEPPITLYEVTLSITAELSVFASASFYYRVNGGAGTWTLLTSNDELDFLCPVYPSTVALTAYPISVVAGQSVEIGVKNDVGTNVTFGLTDSPAATYTPHCGQDTDTLFIPTGDATKYVNLKCTSGTPNVFTTC
jgi:hypothetical protein